MDIEPLFRGCDQGRLANVIKCVPPSSPNAELGGFERGVVNAIASCRGLRSPRAVWLVRLGGSLMWTVAGRACC